jgi:manganese transport protein
LNWEELNANYTLIHVVETVGAIIYGGNIDDHETLRLMKNYYWNTKKCSRSKGYKVETKLGFGKPNKVIPSIINEGQYDVLVMGTHGHTGLNDLLFGTTVDKLRHKISIPLLIVKN